MTSNGGDERRIVLATGNPGKAGELETLLRGLPVQCVLLRELAGGLDVPEPFATFVENAAYKARFAARLGREWALGEDSGLDVDAMAGRPGVYSARFAGHRRPDSERVGLLLNMMMDVPPARRTGRFHCALALASPEGLLGQWHGLCEGRIAEAPRG